VRAIRTGVGSITPEDARTSYASPTATGKLGTKIAMPDKIAAMGQLAKMTGGWT
jgi:hypothetical protein